MPGRSIGRDQYQASNGIVFRVLGEGEPLLLLHGLLVSGDMFDPLLDLLRNDFCMLIPDLRGHGKSGGLPGPYDVPSLAADLDAVMAEAGIERTAVLGYSHGGPVAQQLAHTRPQRISKMILGCTYEHNPGTLRERVECNIFLALLSVFAPATISKLFVRPAKLKPDGEIGLTTEQADWVRKIISKNRAAPMRGAVQGMITFDSRKWLAELNVPTLVIGGTHDHGVPRYHFDALVKGIQGARGELIDRAGHPLIWTHTHQFAELCKRWLTTSSTEKCC